MIVIIYKVAILVHPNRDTGDGTGSISHSSDSSTVRGIFGNRFGNIFSSKKPKRKGTLGLPAQVLSRQSEDPNQMERKGTLRDLLSRKQSQSQDPDKPESNKRRETLRDLIIRKMSTRKQEDDEPKMPAGCMPVFSNLFRSRTQK